MKIEAYDALGNKIIKGSFVQRVFDNIIYKCEVVEVLLKNMILCKGAFGGPVTLCGEEVTVIDNEKN